MSVLYSEVKAIRRVTVLQLLKATQMHSTAPFLINGKDFNLGVLLGNVLVTTVIVRPTFVAFDLADCTGVIRVQLWTDRGQQIAPILECPYVRVVGGVEVYMGANVVRATNVFAARNSYEVYEHTLGVIKDTLMYEIGPPSSQYMRTETPPTSQEFSNDNSELESPNADPPSSSPDVVTQLNAPVRSMNLGSPRSPTNNPGGFGSSQALLRNSYANLNALERNIVESFKDLAHLRPPDDLEGIPIAAILDLVQERTGVDENTVRISLSSLIETGFIYRPITNSHCLLTLNE
ncbi:hypothetical protein C8F04DRAFT_1061953 [Mycena alexandri]|uniref:Replication protein A 32 kDa subunit n=1 Tax=Mycena alexandri TaxID=1745969 RepID=A0AAD6XEB0_9AGAR|nr:hypothetical protein C8F04DRAFT_1061953 [Mycena alexandri]